MTQKSALIIGAGPAGLTAAYELLKNTDIKPIIFEMSTDIGGISKTVNYKGNRIDIGGHRFFSKSGRVMDWWQNIMPLQGKPAIDDVILKRELPIPVENSETDPESTDRVMLIRSRLSRIFFLRSFFDYPISLKLNTFMNLGIVRIAKIGFSYIWINIKPIKNETSLEDFLINRFGTELYNTFFKDYTEKVWGVPCEEIPADWGAQRIKGLSITKTLIHAFKTILSSDKSLDQKNTETSLIGQFLYPKLGPGQLWEEVARLIKKKGGEIHMQHEAVGIEVNSNSAQTLTVRDHKNGKETSHDCDYLFSTMPIKDLVARMTPTQTPDRVKDIAKGLIYRDFITVGLLLKKLKIKNDTKNKTINNIVPDNWIYIQESDVKIGRLQIFNNWSPYMVADRENVWIGLEYFCQEGDELWSKPDPKFIEFAIDELEKIDIISKEDVLDATILRVPKTYPAYFGTYDQFDELCAYTNSLENLFMIGRNGMHRYNNADHSMLTAMVAVENIQQGITTKKNIWEVNTEQEYHESK
ncbi:MAG: protoporphyrinogen oxidase [Desulforhopalus sp.]|jgi:protoporphyrinogen oxidase